MRWIFVLLLIPSLAFPQSGASKRAWKNFQDQEWEKASELASKALEKDSLDALAWFVQSKIAFTPEYSLYNIDVADAKLLRTLSLIDSADEKQKEDYIKSGLAESTLQSHRLAIDQAAFDRAVALMTEDEFNDFLTKFPKTIHEQDAIFKRDSLAYITAVSENTYEGYNRFMTSYPDAIQVGEASARYERLYFDIATKDKTLASYRTFLNENPGTPYRHDAEHAIFQILTADNSLSSYLNFLKEFPEGLVTQKAANYLFHLTGDADDIPFPQRYLTDSLRQVLTLQGPWFPFLEDGSFGMMDAEGKVVMPPSFDSINPEYLCSGLDSDILVHPDGTMMGRNGAIIYRHTNAQVSDIGMGIMRLTTGNKFGAIHKGGYSVLPSIYDDIQQIGRLLAISVNDRWGLASLTGKILVPPRYEEILYENGLYFLGLENGWQILTSEGIHSLANNQIPSIASPVYGSFLFAGEDRLWLQSKATESLTDHQLKPIIAPKGQRIHILPETYIATNEEETLILSQDLMQRFTTGDEMLAFNDHWLVLEKENGAGLFSLKNFRLVTLSDSIQLIGKSFAITYFEGVRKLHTLSNDPILISASITSNIIQASQREWMLLTEKQSVSVLNRQGNLLFRGPADRITPLTDSLLIIEQYGKKELLTLQGEKPLKVRFDGIGLPENNLIPLLSGQRFGAYHITSGTFIRPVSTKRIRPYNNDYFIAEMDKVGLLDKASNKVVDFVFDEIRHWNDTTCLVKEGSEWKFYHIGKGLLPYSPMKSIQTVYDNGEEHEMIIFANNAFGVVHSHRNEIIPPTLDDIINIGSPEQPIYLTDKYVSEANLHVVVYFDGEGRIIRKQAMEEAQFDKLYCD